MSGDEAKAAAPAVGAVLAGGLGSRIGRGKAVVELDGRALIEHPLAAVRRAGLEPVVVAKRSSELPPLELRVIREPERPRHPLLGIVTALRQAGGRPVVVTGCDMPFVSAGLIAWLGSVPAPLAVPVLDGELQPLLARYAPSVLPALEKGLRAKAPLRRTIESLRPRLIGVERLSRFGDPDRIFFNVNTLADLRTAERLLGST
jgi:molybdopterin-guanine dinucleotide biosynthesis protein A